MEQVKSIMPVQVKNGWAARIRFQNGTERVVSADRGGYTMHQAQMLCDTIRRDAAKHGIEAALS